MAQKGNYLTPLNCTLGLIKMVNVLQILLQQIIKEKIASLLVAQQEPYKWHPCYV